MTDRFDIELRLVSNPRYLCVARQVVTTMLDRLGADESLCGQVALAVDEALSNVIRHGYDGRTDQPIWLKLSPTTDGRASCIEIVIEDRAKQVAPDRIVGRDLEDIRPGGLGVHIIRQVMDRVDYASGPEGGMRLTMVKCLDAPRQVNLPKPEPRET
jgi:anti-sigma regulatory factor (Ser/Thr protein kinase)